MAAQKKPVARQADRRASDSLRELFDDDEGVFMISVAAELAGMHPQTLRIYESRGLIKPRRSPKQTRLYSRRDVELLPSKDFPPVRIKVERPGRRDAT